MRRGGGRAGVGVRRGGGDRRVDVRDCTKTRWSSDRKGKDGMLYLICGGITTVTTGSSVLSATRLFRWHFFLTAVFFFACMHMSCFFFFLFYS